MIAEDDGRWLYDKLDQKQRIQTVSGLRAQNRDRGGREAGAERAGPRGGWDLRMCWSDWMHVRRGLSSACVRGGCQLSSYHQPLSSTSSLPSSPSYAHHLSRAQTQISSRLRPTHDSPPAPQQLRSLPWPSRPFPATSFLPPPRLFSCHTTTPMSKYLDAYTALSASSSRSQVAAVLQSITDGANPSSISLLSPSSPSSLLLLLSAGPLTIDDAKRRDLVQAIIDDLAKPSSNSSKRRLSSKGTHLSPSTLTVSQSQPPIPHIIPFLRCSYCSPGRQILRQEPSRFRDHCHPCKSVCSPILIPYLQGCSRRVKRSSSLRRQRHASRRSRSRNAH